MRALLDGGSARLLPFCISSSSSESLGEGLSSDSPPDKPPDTPSEPSHSFRCLSKARPAFNLAAVAAWSLAVAAGSLARWPPLAASVLGGRGSERLSEGSASSSPLAGAVILGAASGHCKRVVYGCLGGLSAWVGMDLLPRETIYLLSGVQCFRVVS